MVCKVCKKELVDGVQFCRHCGAPVINDELSFITEEPSFIAEETAPDTAPADNSDTANNADENYAEQVLAEITAPKGLADNTAPQSTAVALEQDTETSGFSAAQQPEVVKKSSRRKKLNIPATIAVCAAFGILMTAFSAVAVSISSVRTTLGKGAVSGQIDKLYVGDIVVGDTELANGIVEKDKLSEYTTISDVVKIKLDDYEKYIIKGIFKQSNVTVEDLKAIDNVDLEKFAGQIDGINGVDDLDIDTIIQNFSKFDKNEINTIVNEYSKEDFPELTFEIDKRRVEDLLNDRQSPAKSYVSEVVKAYENYLLTGEDAKPVSEESLNKFSQDSVNYILDGMNNAYTEEIHKEMAQVIKENKAAWNTINPSSAFGIFGSILPMSLSNVTMIVMIVLAVVFAAVAALITKRIDAAAITLGVSFMLTGTALICMNAVPANLSQITGLDYKVVSETAAELFKETFVVDFTVHGIVSLLIGVVIVIAVILTKVITRSVKNSKTN